MAGCVVAAGVQRDPAMKRSDGAVMILFQLAGGPAAEYAQARKAATCSWSQATRQSGLEWSWSAHTCVSAH